MSPIYLTQLAARLKEERKRLGFKKQEQMAVALGLPPRTYWDREAGNVAPDAEFLARFCELGGDAMYVLTGAPHHLRAKQPDNTPAERAAEAIQSMRLTEADAQLLVSIAKRLSVAGG